jgi:hypothetical protein
MLVATRDHEPRADARHFGPIDPPRSLASRLTGSVQLLGSIVGIPLALIGGYSTWHTTFSPEAKCQSLRAGIVTMLDKKADASTLRMLVQRDVAAFQRDCAEVDPDAVAAFKSLLTAEKAPAARASAHAKAEPAKPVSIKAEAVKAEPVKAEPVKKDAVKPESIAAKPEPVARTQPIARLEASRPEPKRIQAAAPVVVKREAARPAEEIKPAEAQVATPDTTPPAEEAKPAEVAAVKPEAGHVDAAWVASVRDVLRESASRPLAPAAETTPELAAPMPPPVVVQSQPRLVRDVAPANDGMAPPVPPADIPMAQPKAERPVPPAPIPDGEAADQPAEN